MSDIDCIIDHHCHGIITADLERPEFESLMAEAHLPAPNGCSQFDKPLGLLIRRHCAPLLDLEPHATAPNYVARRLELGGQEASRRLMRATGMSELLIDTGHRSDSILDVPQMAEITNCVTREVPRIEAIMEQAAKQASSATELVDTFDALLQVHSKDAIGFKSIVAYRVTFDIDQTDPNREDVVQAAGNWLADHQANGWSRLCDPVLIR